MNKFNVKLENLELTLEQHEPFKHEQLLELIREMKGKPNTKTLEIVEDIKPLNTIETENVPATHFQTERDPIKFRLPNREQIRLNELKVEVLPQQKSQTFRCPKCHQSTVLSINNIALVRPIDSETTLYESNVVDKTSFTYEEALSNYTGEGDVHLIATDDIFAHCPCCQHSEETMEWIKAYAYSTDNRQKENICPLCGDDIVESFTGTGMKKICDNDHCFSREREIEF
ncbi:MAG: hypothetical protein IIZ99_02845 [Turicibacter sp.]|nr:hypothetical protein [Turicibacter sp.]